MKVRLWRYEMTVSLRKRLSKAEEQAIGRRLIGVDAPEMVIPYATAEQEWADAITQMEAHRDEFIGRVVPLTPWVSGGSAGGINTFPVCPGGIPGCMCGMTEAEQRDHILGSSTQPWIERLDRKVQRMWEAGGDELMRRGDLR